MKRLAALVVAGAILVGLSSTTEAATASTLNAAPVAHVTHTADYNRKVAHIIDLYDTYVVKRERAHLANHYTITFNTFTCAGQQDGCTKRVSATQSATSFSPHFFTLSLPAQRNIVAHEAAHGYGFVNIALYGLPNWSGVSAWQTRFHSLDRSFAGQYDAEAYAACVGWKESGVNMNLVQTDGPCTPAAAAVALSHVG